MSTYREQFDSAMACKTQEEAIAWLSDEIARYGREFGTEPTEAKRVILVNLGYMAGYYDKATSQKVATLFGATHPIFGGPDYWDRVTPEEAFDAGVKAISEVKSAKQRDTSSTAQVGRKGE